MDIMVDVMFVPSVVVMVGSGVVVVVGVGVVDVMVGSGVVVVVGVAVVDVVVGSGVVVVVGSGVVDVVVGVGVVVDVVVGGGVVQTELEVAAVEIENVPAGHAVHPVTLVAPMDSEYVLTGQSKQVGSPSQSYPK